MSNQKVPPGWPADKLGEFLDLARHNVLGSFVHLQSSYEQLRQVDSAYLLICENLGNPPNPFAALFLLKVHSSYRAVAGLALSGQVPEAFMVMRGCIESALYGLYIDRNPDALATWLRRHEDETAKRRVRKEFKIVRLMACLSSADASLHPQVQAMYEKTIDFGAHPNEASLLTALRISKGEEGVRFDLRYLTAETDVLQGTLKSTAETGLCGLCIFRHVFRERFDILGLAEELNELRRGL